MLKQLLCILFIIPSTYASAVHCISGDSSHYRKHVRYVIGEHKKLQKHLVKFAKKEYPDSLIAEKHKAIAEQYDARVQHFSYVRARKSKEPLSTQYRESEVHKGIIEKTYKQLDKTAKECSAALLAKDYVKEAASLQKQAFYGSGKYQYFKKFHASEFLSKLGAGKIAALKQSQQFNMPVINTSKLTDATAQLQAPTIPKLELPDNLQTNTQVNNQAFAFDKPADGVTKKQKFKEAMEGKQMDISIDTTRKDTMLFKPNPYRLMPWQDRLKVGGNFEGGQLLTGAKKFSYTINLTYLLSPLVKPVLGLGYEHSFAIDRNRVQADPVGFTIKAGAELRIYKALSLFFNYENNNQPARTSGESSKRKSDFVLGLTNDTGKKRMLKIWIGIKLGEIAERNPNPFVFRVGL